MKSRGLEFLKFPPFHPGCAFYTRLSACHKQGAVLCKVTHKTIKGTNFVLKSHPDDADLLV